METWMFTTVSVLFACGLAQLLRTALNFFFANINVGVKHNRRLLQISELTNSAISTYIIIVGTYEKCILIGKGLVFEYYVSTYILAVLFSYIVYTGFANPMSLVIKYWEQLIHVISDEDDKAENGFAHVSGSESPRTTHREGVRRRGGESSSSMMSSGSNMTSQEKRKPHSSVWTFFRLSGPSLAGQFLGLHAAIQWLDFAWNGYLTTHHASKTGILRDCIIVLQTGPVQGFIIEAAITFFVAVSVQKISNLSLGGGRSSFLLTSCIMSAITTTILYIFIDITGAFANPVTAYALERGCLLNFTTIINHIIVYVFGSLVGTIAFKVIPPEKHLTILAYIFVIFTVIYFIFPSILVNNFLLF